MATLLNEGFESTTALSAYNREAITGGISRSLTQAKNGVAACKFYINKADTGYGGGPHRSEIHSPIEEYLFNQDYWIGCNVYLENWASDPEPEQIIQFHNVPNFGAGETWGTLKLLTPFGIQIKNNTYEIVHGFVKDSDAANPNGVLNNNRVSAGAIANNAWTKWVIHCRWHYATGILEVWKDDVLVYSKTGNTYYNDEKGPYHKIGVYKWPWTHVGNISTTTQRIMYLDNWKIAQGSGTVYNDVNPQPNNMTSTSPNIIVTVTEAGTYTGRLIVTANGLSTEEVVEVIVKPDPVTPLPVSTMIGWATVAGGTTGGAGGTTVRVSTLTALINALSSALPMIIQVSGTIKGNNSYNVRSNKTIIGLPDAVLDGVGLSVWGNSNVIIRNLISRNCTIDGITITRGSHHVWIDHVTFESAVDELLDINKQSNYVTVSHCKFMGNGYGMLIGGGAENSANIGLLKTTVHHCEFLDISERVPMASYGKVHFFNNYVHHTTGTTLNQPQVMVLNSAEMYLENTVFENIANGSISAETANPSGGIGKVKQVNVSKINCGADKIDTPESTWVPTEYVYASMLKATADAKKYVVSNAGNTLTLVDLGITV